MNLSTQQKTTPRRLLLVDDSDAFRERLGRALRDRGLDVQTAANYQEAIEVVQGRDENVQPPDVSPGSPTNRTPSHSSEKMLDLAVIDLRMPGKSGLELLKDLKQISPHTQVLVLTGFGSIATAVDAVRLGAANFLPKPADADDVLAAFDRAETNVRESSVHDGGAHPQAPSLARTEWEHIHRVLADCDGNVSEAARRLGIHRRSLQRKLRKRAPE